MARELPTHCQNCGTLLTGEYCHVCGQKADEPRRAVIGLVQDFFIDTLAIDGKLFRTIGLLLWKPGLLARHYLDGKRQTYSPPFRLYLFTSVFFFFALFWAYDFAASPTTPEESAEALEEAEAALSAARRGAETSLESTIEELDPTLREAFTSDEEAPDEGAEETPQEAVSIDMDDDLPDWAETRILDFVEAAQRVSEDPRLFLAQARENLPRVLLIAPIVYAVLLLLLYFYRWSFYVYDHFVISLYMHAALYAYLLSAILLSQIPYVGFLGFVPLAWGAFQPMFVLRQAYGSNWISTLGKAFISNTLYLSALSFLIGLGVMWSLYQS